MCMTKGEKWIFQQCVKRLPVSTIQIKLQAKQMTLSTGIKLILTVILIGAILYEAKAFVCPKSGYS